MTFVDADSAQTRYDVIWNCTPIFISKTLFIFHGKIASSEVGGGMGLYIFSWNNAV